MAGKNVEVKLSANVAQYKAAMGEASKATDQVGTSTDKTTSSVGSKWSSTGSQISGAMGLSMAAVGAGAVLLAKTSIDAASNLEESINAVNVSYGESAEAVHKLGDESVESFGLSQRAFNEAAVSFTSFAEDIAGDGGNVAGTLNDLMLRSTDFASVMNMDVGAAADAFKSALAGEAEPLKRFGINISDAAVKSHALETGLIGVGEAMTDQQKVQARYSLLMKETEKVAGDFANTQDGYANSMKMAKANAEDLAASFGALLLPQLTNVLGSANDLVGVWDKLSKSDPVQLVIEVNDMVPGGGALKWANDLAGALNPLGQAQMLLGPVGDALDDLNGSADEGAEAMDGYKSSVTLVNDAITIALGAQRAANDEVDRAAASSAYAEENARRYNAALDDQKNATDAVRDAHEALKSALSDRSALLELQDEFDLTAEAGVEAYVAVATGAENAEELARDYEQQVIRNKDAIIAYAEEVGGIPEERLTSLLAMIDRGSMEAAEQAIEWLARPRTFKLNPSTGGVPMYADGTDFHPGGLAIVGDGGGPELVSLPRGSKVYTASETRMMASNMQPAPQPVYSGGGSTSTTGVNIEKATFTRGVEIDDVYRVANAHLAMAS